MKIQIGAMSVGDILDRGLKLLRARLPTYYAVDLLVLCPILLVELAIPLLQGGQPQSLPAVQLQQLAGGLAALLLTTILQPIATAAILHIIAQEFIDQRAEMGEALRFALHRFGRVLFASLLAGLLIMFGSLCCIAPGLLFAVWYVFVGQVVIVEGLKGEKALARSKELTSGYRWRVFGMFMLFLVIGFLSGAAIGALQRVLPSAELVPTAAGLRAIPNFRNQAIHIVLNTLINFLVQTYSAICFTLLYFDLRIRKEGFDLELAARQQAAPS
ncbi:MAG TPA: hypothetical protein VKU02_22665 [Gemmataceae bacterium]|nr:hypothetical protein [Gemmataceae bacterium]